MLSRGLNAMRRLLARRTEPDPGAILRNVMQQVSQGDLDGAKRSAAGLSGDAALAAYADAIIGEAAGETAAALERALAAMRLAPGEPVYWLKCAQLHAAAGDHRDAATLYGRLVGLADAPFASDPDILLSFAAASERAGDPETAIGLLEKLLRIRPDDRQARANLAMLLALSARSEDARMALDVPVADGLPVGMRLKRALMLPSIHQSAEHIEAVRTRFSRELDEVMEMPVADLREPAFEIGLVPFMLAYQGHDNTGLLRKFARAVRRHHPAAGLADTPPLRPGPRIRVGFVSRHFRAHSVARTTWGLIHDLPRERFEVFVFGIEMRDDAWSRTIRDSADISVPLPGDPEQVRTVIGGARLDVLIFADLGMEPLTYYLAFRRLAPIQMTTWGHPVTSGIDTIDYYISAEGLEEEDADRRYAERLVRLPGFFMPRYLPPPNLRRTPASGPRGDGLTTYFCSQTAFKLHPDFDAALLAILERDPRAAILLMETTPEMGRQTRRRLERSLGSQSHRVRFLPPMAIDRFLQMQADADVLLDPFHFGGCNSTFEALGLSSPIVTLPGPYLASRFTVAAYRELGIESCVAKSASEYVDIAVRLGTDGAFRAEVVGGIGARRARLFERSDAGRALGDALEAIVEQRLRRH